MITNFSISFRLVGKNPRSRHALFNNASVEAKRDSLYARIKEKALESLAALTWKDGFPSNGQEWSHYETLIVEGLAHVALKRVALSLESEFLEPRESLARKFADYLDDNSSSDLVNDLLQSTIPRLQLRSEAPHACIPYGDDKHICTTTLFQTVPMQELIIKISSGQDNFAYELDCEIIFSRTA